MPYFAKNSSIDASAPFVHILSTTSRPSILAIQKHKAAPAIEEAHERMQPCHHPNRLAFVSVMKNAGSGAAIDWNIITVEKPLFEFYVSLRNDPNSMFNGERHAGFGGCPNHTYKTTVYTNNASGQAVSTNVSVYKAGTNALVATLTSGESVYLYEGDYIAKATINGEPCEKSFTVADGAKTVYLNAVNTDGYINGAVVDKTTGAGLAGVTIKVYEYSACVATSTTDASGVYRITLDNGDYRLEASKDGYVTAIQHFTLRGGENKYLETMTLAKTDASRIMGGIYGTIKDGVTGQTVSNVDIKISKGWGNEGAAGTYVAELKTNSYGQYEYRKT